MAREPLRLRATGLTTLTLAVILATSSCTTPARAQDTLSPATTTTTPQPTADQDATAGAVGPDTDDYIDPEQTSEPIPVPDDTDTANDTPPDPDQYGLTTAQEEAAQTVAYEFINQIWTWDSTDTNDRAGLRRALPLVTEQLAQQLQPYLDQPRYEAEEWDDLAASGGIGSASEVLSVAPAPSGNFDATTYTVLAIYRLYSIDPDGVLTAREEEARYATLELTTTGGGTWLVAALPYLDAEQLIEPAP